VRVSVSLLSIYIVQEYNRRMQTVKEDKVEKRK
jgi:hypothetical protein